MGPAPLRVRPVQAVFGEHQLHPPVMGGAGDLGQQQRRPAQGGGTAGVVRQPAVIKAAPLAQTAAGGVEGQTGHQHKADGVLAHQGAVLPRLQHPVGVGDQRAVRPDKPGLQAMARQTAGQADRLAPRPEGGEEAGGVGLAPHAVVEQQGIRRLHLGQGQKAGEQGVIARPPDLGRELSQILAGPAAQLRLLSRGSGRHGRPAGRPPPP